MSSPGVSELVKSERIAVVGAFVVLEKGSSTGSRS